MQQVMGHADYRTWLMPRHLHKSQMHKSKRESASYAQFVMAQKDFLWLFGGWLDSQLHEVR